MLKFHFREEKIGIYVSMENVVASHSNMNSLALFLCSNCNKKFLKGYFKKIIMVILKINKI